MGSSVLHVRLADADLARLEAEARSLGLPISTYARSLLLRGMGQVDPVDAVLDALETNPKLRHRLHRILVLLPTEP